MFVLLLVALLGSCIVPLSARYVGKGAGFIVALLPFGLAAAFVAYAPVVERGWVRGEGIAWAHIDLAGPAFLEAEDGENPKGGTGFGVRLLTELAVTFEKPSKPAKAAKPAISANAN